MSNQNEVSLSNEMEQMLLLLEKLGDIARLYLTKNSEIAKDNEQGQQDKNQTADPPSTDASNNKNIQESSGISFQSQIDDAFKEFMQEFSNEFVVKRKNLIDKVEALVQSQSVDVNQDLSETRIPASPTMEQQTIIRDVDKLEKAVNSVAAQTDQLKTVPVNSAERTTLLQSIGAGLIDIENKRLALGEKIKTFFTTLPNQLELGFSKWLTNHLERLNERIGELDQKLSNDLNPEKRVVETAEKSSEVTEEKEEVKALDYPEKSNQIIQDIRIKLTELSQSVSDEYKLARESQAVANQKTPAQSEEDTAIIAEKSGQPNDREDNVVPKDKTIGIQTEIDPDAGLMESLKGREAQGIRTTAAVKEEIEDVTMSDYGETMEEAYQHSEDPDPDAAAFPTEAQMEYEEEEYGYEIDY